MAANRDWEADELMSQPTGDRSAEAKLEALPSILSNNQVINQSESGVITWPYITTDADVHWLPIPAFGLKPAAVLIDLSKSSKLIKSSESSKSSESIITAYCACAYILCRFRFIAYRRIESINRATGVPTNIPENIAAALAVLDDLGHWLHIHKPNDDWQQAFRDAESPGIWAEWQSQVAELRRATDQIVPRPPQDAHRWLDLRNPDAAADGVTNVVGSGMTLEEYNESIDRRNEATRIAETETRKRSDRAERSDSATTATPSPARGRRRRQADDSVRVADPGPAMPSLFDNPA